MGSVREESGQETIKDSTTRLCMVQTADISRPQVTRDWASSNHPFPSPFSMFPLPPDLIFLPICHSCVLGHYHVLLVSPPVIPTSSSLPFLISTTFILAPFLSCSLSIYVLLPMNYSSLDIDTHRALVLFPK